MNRRKFTQQTLMASAALCLTPELTFTSLKKIDKDELIGKGQPILVGENYRLRKAAAKAFEAMNESAQKENFNIKAVSSYRSYEAQNRIWERKFKQFTQEGMNPTKAIDKITEYSTIPGTSRHHWGTDVDIVLENNLGLADELLEEHFTSNGPFYEFKNWLNEHAESFGFYEVYTSTPNRKGFKYEPWHFSFKPLSKKYLEAYMKLDIAQILKTSLMGGEYLTEHFIQKYITENILDINCRLK